MRDSWLDELRHIHDEHFDYGWHEHLRGLNGSLGLEGAAALGLAAPGLPPSWFVGDAEALEPGEWVLAVSLNQALREEHAEEHARQRYTRQTYWDHWRWLNRNWWHPGFYGRPVRLAAGAMGADVGSGTEPEFATTRMVFVELCPYASRGWPFSGEDVRRLTATDLGFRLATRVRELLIEGGRPALIAVNGRDAIGGLEHAHGSKVHLAGRRSYASVHRPERTLWHSEGYYRAGDARVPLLAFPFLGKPRTHNAYVEVDQLAAAARALIREAGAV